VALAAGARTDRAIRLAAQLVAGGNFTVGLHANGSVICWGDNSMGQCTVPAHLRTGGLAVKVCGAP
jgi:alpha-tubulin suppressor-like RCC1 family protein